MGEKAKRRPKANPKEFSVAQDGWEIIECKCGPTERVKSLKEGQRRPASMEDAFSGSLAYPTVTERGSSSNLLLIIESSTGHLLHARHCTKPWI